MKLPIELHAVTHEPHDQILPRIADAIDEADFRVLDVHLFSDLQAALLLEVTGPRFTRLGEHLAPLHVRLTDASVKTLASAPPDVEAASLEITFAHGKGDLRRVVPAVP